jgi:hypothetical protein
MTRTRAHRIFALCHRPLVHRPPRSYRGCGLTGYASETLGAAIEAVKHPDDYGHQRTAATKSEAA